MDRFTALTVAMGMLGLGGAFSIGNDRPVQIAKTEQTAMFTVLRICFPATQSAKAHCIDDHGKVFDRRGVSMADCTRLAAAKVGTLASGAKVLRGYCQEEEARDSYQVNVPSSQKHCVTRDPTSGIISARPSSCVEGEGVNLEDPAPARP